MLQVDPNDRPTVHDIIDRLQEIAIAKDVSLKGPLHIAENRPSNIGNVCDLQVLIFLIPSL